MKKWIALLLAALLLFSTSTAAFATGSDTSGEPELNYITDSVGVLTDDEWSTLEIQAEAASERHDIGIYALILDNYTEYGDGSASDVAKAIYREYNLGLGDNKSGVCLLFSHNDGKIAVIDYEDATDLINGQEEKITNAFIEGYETGGFASAINRYISTTDSVLKEATGGATTESDKSDTEKSEADTADKDKAPEKEDTAPVEEAATSEKLSTNLNTTSYVTDVAGILSDSERKSLETRAKEISEQYGCGVYIVTIEDYEAYSSESLYETAKLIYKDSDLGMGDNKSGILLLLTMSSRNYALITYGDGNDKLNADGKDWLSPKFVKEFKKDRWADGFSVYLEKSAYALQRAEDGKTITWTKLPIAYPIGFILSLLAGAFLARLTGSMLKDQLISVNAKTHAKGYIAQGGVNITHRDQRLINVETHRRYIDTSSSSGGSSGGGGSRSVDSDGFSGKTGSF